ncbi:MAG: hypothetical protein ACLGIZ_08280 [Acidimicrobiia bacterium]|jgi:hypothetical protein
MRVVIGPVSVASATAWLDHADEVIDELAVVAPGECFTTSEVLEVFRGYLRSWRAAAVGTELVWEADIAPEQVEYDMHAFQRVVDMRSQRAAERGRVAPPEGEDFYLALLHGVLGALQAEGPASASFAKHLAEFWPGRDPLG